MNISVSYFPIKKIHCMPERGVRLVRNTKLLARLTDNGRDGRQVGVIETREQVVFNLVIKPSRNHGPEWRVNGKVGGCHHLKHSPVSFVICKIAIRKRAFLRQVIHTKHQYKYISISRQQEYGTIIGVKEDTQWPP